MNPAPALSVTLTSYGPAGGAVDAPDILDLARMADDAGVDDEEESVSGGRDPLGEEIIVESPAAQTSTAAAAAAAPAAETSKGN